MESAATIGRYRILGLLGKGAMGVVYRARDEALERDVAVKVMLGHGADEDARTRFTREARAVARLQHPNIVTVYELGEHREAPFIAMELLQGTDLQRAIEGGLRPDPRVTLPIVLQLLYGLGHAHENGIVHRDVKPSNLFLPRGLPAKIMDFGVARLSGGTSTGGHVVGTPNYMSPEQVSGAAVDGRSDLFSAGLILYELVTGEKAYRADSIVSILYKIAHEAPDLKLLPSSPEWRRLRNVLESALARDPSARYPDALTMASDLEDALHALGGGYEALGADRALLRTPRPEPPPDDELPSIVHEDASPVTAEPLPGATRWLLPVAIVVGAAAVLALGLTLVALTQHPTDVPPSSPNAASAPPPARATAAPVAAAPGAATATATAVTAAPVVTAIPSAASVTRPPVIAAAATATALALPSPSPDAGTPEPEGPLDRRSVAGRLERGQAHFAVGRYGQALADARAVLAVEPRNEEAKALAEDAEAAQVVETRLRNANEALRRGDRETALAEVRLGLAVAPTDARLLQLFDRINE